MDYSITQADLVEEKKNIVHFWKKNFPTWPHPKFDWFYCLNIYGESTCWIIENDKEKNKNEKIVGTTVLFPRDFMVHGSPIKSAITGDFAVDKKHRTLGPALRLQKATINKCNEDTYEFIYGFPNNNSEPVQKRAGFKIVGSTVRMVKVLQSNFYIKRLFRSDFLASIFSPFANLLLFFIGKENRMVLSKKFSMKIVKEVDDRFDTLWEKASHNFTLIGQRNRDFIHWRFIQCPYIDYTVFTLNNNESNELVGYIVYYHTENSITIADCLAENNNEAFDRLITSFLRYTKKTKAHSVSVAYLGNGFFIKKLKKFNFIPREDSRRVVAYIRENSKRKEFILDPENWYYFEADND